MGTGRWGVALVVSALVAAGACGGGGGGDGDGRGVEAARPATIVIGTTESLQNSFDPAQAYDYLGSQVVFNTAETLVTYAPDATEPTPKLAAALPDVSADGLTYTFVLRAGVKFADGTPFNAAAVKFSLERAKDFGAKDPESAGFLLSGIRSIDAPSDDKVVISLTQPNVTFLSRLAYSVASIVSPAAYAGHVLAGTEEGAAVTAKYKTDTIVGTGPYRVTAYKERESIDLEANPDYWGTKPKTKRIRMRLFDKSSALKLALQNNEVDIAFRSLQPDENNFFKDRPGFKLIEGKGSGIRYLVINVTAKPWDNVNMRRALAAAVNRKVVVDEVFKGSAKAAGVDGARRRSTPPSRSGSSSTGPTPRHRRRRRRAGRPRRARPWSTSTCRRPASRAGRCRSTSGTARPTTATPRSGRGRGDRPVPGGDEALHGEGPQRRVGRVRQEAPGRGDAGVPHGLVPRLPRPRRLPGAVLRPQHLRPGQVERPEDAGARPHRAADARPARRADGHPSRPRPTWPTRCRTSRCSRQPQFAATSDKVSGVVLDPIQIFRFWLLEKTG